MRLLKDYRNYKLSLTQNTIRGGFLLIFVALFAALYLINRPGAIFNDELTDSGYFVQLLLFLGAIFIYMNTIIHTKPNLAATLPVSAKRRTAYMFVYPLIDTLICFAVFVVMGFLFFGISLLYQQISYGVTDLEYYLEEEFYTSTGVWAELSVWLIFVSLYSMLVAALNFKSWRRYIGIAVCVAVTFFITLVTVNIPAGSFILSGNFYLSISLMRLPWLYTLVLFVVTALITSASVYITYRSLKPKDY